VSTQKIPCIVTRGFQIRHKPGTAAEYFGVGDRVNLTADQLAQFSSSVRTVAEVEEERRAAAEGAQAEEAKRKQAEQAEKLQARLTAQTTGLSSASYADAIEQAIARRNAPIELRRKQLAGRAPWGEMPAAPQIERLPAEVGERWPEGLPRPHLALVEPPAAEVEMEIPDRDSPSVESHPAPGGAAAIVDSLGASYGAAVAAARARFGGEAA